MNRRAARRLAPIRLLIAVAAVMVSLIVPFGAPSDRALADAASTVPEPPPVTANDFLPEERDLSDCVGALEKPGCGSEERGGPMMTVVFVMVIAGMSFIFWRVIVGVRQNRAALDPPGPERSGPDPSGPDPSGADPAEAVDP